LSETGFSWAGHYPDTGHATGAASILEPPLPRRRWERVALGFWQVRLSTRAYRERTRRPNPQLNRGRFWGVSHPQRFTDYDTRSDLGNPPNPLCPSFSFCPPIVSKQVGEGVARRIHAKPRDGGRSSDSGRTRASSACSSRANSPPPLLEKGGSARCSALQGGRHLRGDGPDERREDSGRLHRRDRRCQVLRIPVALFQSVILTEPAARAAPLEDRCQAVQAGDGRYRPRRRPAFRQAKTPTVCAMKASAPEEDPRRQLRLVFAQVQRSSTRRAGWSGARPDRTHREARHPPASITDRRVK